MRRFCWAASVSVLIAAFALTLGNDEVTATSAQDYLGQFTYFRGWNSKRRLYIVKTRDDGRVDDVLDEATQEFRCQMAIRNMNLSEEMRQWHP